MKLFRKDENGEGLSPETIKELLRESLEGRKLRHVLIIPPDYTRYHSNAGWITNTYCHLLEEMGIQADILIAQGTHEPISPEQFAEMYGDIPYERMIRHRWREDTVEIGRVPVEFVGQITDGLWKEAVPVEINRRVLDPRYDLILSIGQVVPHEIIGMANHAKNLFVGVGGSRVIHQSHMIGAVYGMERIMGKDHTPVRKLFDYMLEHFLTDVPVLFVLTVTTAQKSRIKTHGVFIGDTRKTLEDAVALSQQYNIDFLAHGIQKCVVYLDPKEFRSTWLGNKAIYRTRMAMADGGELLILAPGITQFGEDLQNDAVIRKYGYQGRLKILELVQQNRDLQENMGVAAHLIHGSSDGRFRINYAVEQISKEEMESVHFDSMDYQEAVKRYDPAKLSYGWNTMEDGEEIFFVPNPALGLWIDRNRFDEVQNP